MNFNLSTSRPEEIICTFNSFGFVSPLAGEKVTKEDIALRFPHFANNIKDDDTDLNYQYADKDDLRFK